MLFLFSPLPRPPIERQELGRRHRGSHIDSSVVLSIETINPIGSIDDRTKKLAEHKAQYEIQISSQDQTSFNQRQSKHQ